MTRPHDAESIHLRLAMAEQDLRASDDVHLATATNATLIAINVRLRGALADMIRLHRERNDDREEP